MARLEELTRGAVIRGILPDRLVTVVDARWFGSNVIELVYRDGGGTLGQELVYRDREPTLEIAEAGTPWAFDGDGAQFRLAAEARRIRLAYLFDPLLAVHTSLVEPLPHQITAVYGEMLGRQPLRFLLADDPGAGKTIMSGLLIRELAMRGDLKRCLVVCPGALAEQWQDELSQRFALNFEILTNEKIEAARTGNWFLENSLIIARLDKLSRDSDLQAKLEATDWDLVIVDEAHKMSATYFGSEVKYTKRYHLGQLLGRLTRHFLLLTATPHNGKEEDFQLFLALLDADRFEGKPRDGAHTVDASDLMRRLTKEQLRRFDGRPLLPERLAYAVSYELSDAEAQLYEAVTKYVQEEFNRADALEAEGQRGTVGFALTILQRRLASSPEAIYQSLRRRRERLEKRVREEQLLQRGRQAALSLAPALSDEEIDELEDAPDAEVQETEERLVDQASAARTIAELQLEIETLKHLEILAQRVRATGTDRKWEELSRLLHDNPEMRDASGALRKLVIFTEHRDTLNYLQQKIRTLLGRPEALVAIHGGMGREERRNAQEAFAQNKDVQVLVATDAAGEGINLQRAHLMVNYDLPWNPNRIEQRFGRIHRIGQTEVCHLWNLVADQTREGEVLKRLFEKLEEERKALGGAVFDILGKMFRETRLRDLLIEAIRYGDRPEVKARLQATVDNLADRRHCQELIEERALAHDSMDARQVALIREEMERAEAHRLQPHFIAGFFLAAFRLLGGSVHEREPKRYEVTHVPAEIRSRDRLIGRGEAVLPRYERITFEKELIAAPGQPLAAFVCPGHPLLEATRELIEERYRDLLRRGATLVARGDPSETPRALLFLEHSIQDGSVDASGQRRVVSRQMQFVEMLADGTVRSAGYAPYLDYEPPKPNERESAAAALDGAAWLRSGLEDRALEYAVRELAPGHLAEVRQRKEKRVAKTEAAVRDRLTKEINYWDLRANDLKLQEQAGKVNARINSEKARQRADDLQARLQRRLEELAQERRLAALPPVVVGGALVVPEGALGQPNVAGAPPALAANGRARDRVEQLAMAAVMAAERAAGFEPRDVSSENCGYDIESRAGEGRLRFIEVKGRVKGATTVTVTKNEILTALNKPEDFLLALVEVDLDREGTAAAPRYVQRPFKREPDFAASAVTYSIRDLESDAGVLAAALD